MRVWSRECIKYFSFVASLITFLAVSNRNYVVTGGLTFLVSSQLAVTIIYLTKARTLRRVEQLVSIVDYERAMNVMIFVTDTTIALTLMYYLWNLRSGFRRTQHILKRLVSYTIGTGLIVGMMMIGAFVAAEVFPNTLIYILLDFCIAKSALSICLSSARGMNSFLCSAL